MEDDDELFKVRILQDDPLLSLTLSHPGIAAAAARAILEAAAKDGGDPPTGEGEPAPRE